jgi:cytochrome c biogenesis protein CcdA/glutaredoxin
MRYWKFAILILLTLFGTYSLPNYVSAAEKMMIEVLERWDCGHCEEEKAFLSALVSRRDDVEFRLIDIETPEGADLFDRTVRKMGLSRSTPITAVSGTIIQGFDSGDTTGRRIEQLLDSGISDGYPSGFERILSSGDAVVESQTGSTCETGDVCRPPVPDTFFVMLPFLGATDVSMYSLPVLASVLGLVDGFNPCALWVLITFLLVLLQIGNRARMTLIAGLFVLAEMVMYYLILNVWFTAWDFIGLDRIVTPLIGVVAIGGGLFFLYEWKAGDGTCKVTNIGRRAQISGQIRKLASKPFTWVTAVGVVALALSVNVIEFACSIGIPQAFTKILELNNLGFLGTQGLMLLYILFYMIDDFLVFGLALWGAGKLQSVHGYAKWCNLFGGILMILLGLLLIVRPDSLMF